MRKTFLWSMLLLSILAYSCTSSTSKNEEAGQTSNDNEAAEVIDRAISWAGSMTKWETLQTINYTKRSRLLLENQDVEYDITQAHAYSLQPSLRMDIQWDTDNGRNQLLYTDTLSVRYLNVSIIDRGTKVEESAFSAFYVLGMPFKLKDPGVTLVYEGTKDFNGKTADIIRATYSPGEFDNHSTSDQWWYYFDQTDGAFLGCMVYHPPTYALIENIAFHDVEGMKFQKRRMSYRCDSLGNKQFLRAEFWYEDFEVSFTE